MASFRGVARGLIEKEEDGFGAAASEFDHTVFSHNPNDDK